MSKTQYIVVMGFSVVLMVVSVVVGVISWVDAHRRADERGYVMVRRRGANIPAEYPAHFAALFAPTCLFLMGLGFAYLAYRTYHEE